MKEIGMKGVSGDPEASYPMQPLTYLLKEVRIVFLGFVLFVLFCLITDASELPPSETEMSLVVEFQLPFEDNNSK